MVGDVEEIRKKQNPTLKDSECSNNTSSYLLCETPPSSLVRTEKILKFLFTFVM